MSIRFTLDGQDIDPSLVLPTILDRDDGDGIAADGFLLWVRGRPGEPFPLAGIALYGLSLAARNDIIIDKTLQAMMSDAIDAKTDAEA